jgi:hypothetical protein
MGTDIHLICEVKENGKWRKNTDKVFPNSNYHYLQEIIKKDPNYKVPPFWEGDLDKPFDDDPESSRNYDKFAILADVRNGTGFAGCVTGRGFEPISSHRGFPDDVDQEFKESYDDWTHSATWVSLKDFLDYNWDRMTIKSGVITLEEYKKLKDPLSKHNTKTPNSWSGGVFGGNNITISMEEANKVIRGELTELTRVNEHFRKEETLTKPINEWKINVQYEWYVKYSEWFDTFIKNWVEPIKELGKKYEDVRITMSFDS